MALGSPALLAQDKPAPAAATKVTELPPTAFEPPPEVKALISK